jgi:hypothetical protein
MIRIFDIAHLVSFSECDVSETESILINIMVTLDTVCPLISYKTGLRKLVVFSDVDKTLTNTAARGGLMDLGAPKHTEIKIRFGFFCTRVLSSDNRQYFGSLL